MRVSTKGRYALRVMIDLAENAGTVVPLRKISERQDIPVKYLEHIIAALVKAELVSGSRGNGGGYTLSRRPSDYKVGEILRASEGNFCPAPCTEEDCEKYRECRASEFWRGLEKAVNTYIDSQTLDDVVKSSTPASRRDPSIWIL